MSCAYCMEEISFHRKPDGVIALRHGNPMVMQRYGFDVVVPTNKQIHEMPNRLVRSCRLKGAGAEVEEKR